MSELLEKNQIMSIIPQDFRNANKGKIVDIQKSYFSMEVFHSPQGILPKKVMEFYAPTKNGMLYFVSDIKAVNDKKLTIGIPAKHRFLQRRTFMRINFEQDIKLKAENEKPANAKTIDISFGGLKIQTKEKLNLDSEYTTQINITSLNTINCTFKPIRIEKNDEDVYTLSGRFKNLSNTDKMSLIQFCIRRTLEDSSK
jgi:c-di-GMP-binding flagellar brake protein YcgR